MSKILPLIALAFLLNGCEAKKQALGLRAAVLAKLQADPDLKDYKLDPEPIADCVVQAVSDGAPSIPGDPRRDTYFAAYTKFFNASSPGEADAVIKEYKDFFGSEKAANEAALGITDHIMSCMGQAIDERGE
jgi:hypothetical protein